MKQRTRTHFLDCVGKLFAKLNLISRLDQFNYYLHSREIPHKHFDYSDGHLIVRLKLPERVDAREDTANKEGI